MRPLKQDQRAKALANVLAEEFSQLRIDSPGAQRRWACDAIAAYYEAMLRQFTQDAHWPIDKISIQGATLGSPHAIALQARDIGQWANAFPHVPQTSPVVDFTLGLRITDANAFAASLAGAMRNSTNKERFAPAVTQFVDELVRRWPSAEVPIAGLAFCLADFLNGTSTRVVKGLDPSDRFALKDAIAPVVAEVLSQLGQSLGCGEELKRELALAYQIAGDNLHETGRSAVTGTNQWLADRLAAMGVHD